MKKDLKLLILTSLILVWLPGCSVVQPWQKEKLSLNPMQANDCPLHRFERNAESYREGAVGGNGGKSGGGCGCS